MNKLSLLLVLCILSLSNANAAKVEPSDISLSLSGASNFELQQSNDENNLTILSKFRQTSQFTAETDSVPPTSWIVGLGLCLVFVGYKLKNKAE